MAPPPKPMGWEPTQKRADTCPGAGDFSSYIAPVAETLALIILVLNHYGGDMSNSLTQAVAVFGLKDKMVNAKASSRSSCRLYSELMAKVQVPTSPPKGRSNARMKLGTGKLQDEGPRLSSSRS